MERPGFQLSLGGMLVVVACIALNIWLFRVGMLLGLIGLNVTKHVVIAWLCQVIGVDKRGSQPASPTGTAVPAPSIPLR
jgi:hypothetical protein